MPASPLAKLFSSNWPNTDHIRVHCICLCSRDDYYSKTRFDYFIRSFILDSYFEKTFSITVSAKSKKQNQHLLLKKKKKQVTPKYVFPTFENNLIYLTLISCHYNTLIDKMYTLALAQNLYLPQYIIFCSLFQKFVIYWAFFKKLLQYLKSYNALS